MSFNTFSLLIHHHSAVYVDEDNRKHVNSGIGRWVSELSNSFGAIGLLMPISSTRDKRQDHILAEDNIRLHSLGSPGHYWDYFRKRKRISETCSRVSDSYDGLIVRGITSQQYLVWRSVKVPRKAYLLVRDLTQDKITEISWRKLFSHIVTKYREAQLPKMFYDTNTIFVNSKRNQEGILHGFRKSTTLVSTNVIREEEIPNYHFNQLRFPVKLVFVGRVSMLKGIRELFEAISITKKYGISVELDLVGQVKQDEFDSFTSLARALDINECITWHGFLDYGPDLFRMYQNADLFVLPTYTEGFPRVLWEAAAFSCPIVTTATGGIPELFDNGKSALLVPPQSATELAAAILMLISDEGARKRISMNAYELVKSNSLEKSIAKMINVLKRKWLREIK